MSNTDLQGKTALVTGGTKGIGKAIADRLSQSGATVFVTARNKPADLNPAHQFIAADFQQPEQITALAQEIKQLDILINNVGGLTTPGGGYANLTNEHWEKELQLNLLAAIQLDRTLLPKMQSGVVIHISSVAGLLPIWELNMAYAVSKAALNAYSKTLAKEMGPKGIRVLTVSPGAVATPPMLQVIEDVAKGYGITTEQALEKMAEKFGGIPMGRMAEPTEVASLVNYLVSPEAAYLTGANYLIDGGGIPVV
jgi:NAD(P)-dependent dehydrogenase (short-subunit alcohol dehydrogenase family)